MTRMILALAHKARMDEIRNRFNHEPWCQGPDCPCKRGIKPPTFRCGYRGATFIMWGGKEWAVRHTAISGDGPTATSADGHYNGDYFYKGILPAVGTVIGEHSDNFHEFPPDDLLAFYPGYVGAKWPDDFASIVYNGPAPILAQEWKRYFTFITEVHDERKCDHDDEPRRPRRRRAEACHGPVPEPR